MRNWRTDSAEATRSLGRQLAEELGTDAVVLLYGDLGSGKTVLVQGIAAALGIAASEVQSPTFTLVREHAGPMGRLVHIDLYRLDEDDLPGIGLEELLAERAITVIEWADRLPWAVEADLALELRRSKLQGEREIREVGRPS